MLFIFYFLFGCTTANFRSLRGTVSKRRLSLKINFPMFTHVKDKLKFLPFLYQENIKELCSKMAHKELN